MRGDKYLCQENQEKAFVLPQRFHLIHVNRVVKTITIFMLRDDEIGRIAVKFAFGVTFQRGKLSTEPVDAL